MNLKERIASIKRASELEPILIRTGDKEADLGLLGFEKGCQKMAKNCFEIIKELEAIVEIQSKAIVVADCCLSDFVITKHGLKIMNEKDLEDAQSVLKKTLKKTNKLMKEK